MLLEFCYEEGSEGFPFCYEEGSKGFLVVRLYVNFKP